MSSTAIAQVIDTTDDGSRLIELIDRLDDVPDPDAIASRGQELMDEHRTFEQGGPSRVTVHTQMQLNPALADSSEYVRHYYRGSPIKTSSSIVARTADVELSLVEAKDPGEPLYFDHLVGSLSIRKPIDAGPFSVEHFIIGSYGLNYGEGLVFGKGYPIFPSVSNISVRRSAATITPYRSTSSYRYFNGAATTVEAGSFSIDGFYSDRSIDATIDSGSIAYVSTSGYHRTTTELDRMGTTQQTVAGGALRWHSPEDVSLHLQLGIVGCDTRYDLPLTVDTTSPQFGHDNTRVLSAFCTVHDSIFYLSTEIGASFVPSRTTTSFALSSTIRLASPLLLSANVHIIPPEYYSPFLGTFGAASDNDLHERGCYLGVSYAMSNVLQLRAYSTLSFEHIGSPDVGATTRSVESALGLLYDNSKRSVDARIRYSVATETPRTFSDGRIRYEERLSGTVLLTLLGRIRSLSIDGERTVAYTAGIGATLRPMHVLSCSAFIEPYTVPTFDVRLYSIEPEIGDILPFVPLYGSGTRVKFVAALNLDDRIHVEASFGQSVFSYPANTPTRRTTTIACSATARL
ncbi:MAG: hypothetical protein JSS75_13420 [Bacteroidetes bacterium]|nr:hypothetical protein [Bacteroidota bacterium]